MELVDTEGKTVGGKVVTCYVTGPAETRGLAKEIAAAAKPRPLVHSARLFMLTPVKEGDSEKDPERMRKVRKWTEQHLKAKVELFPGKVRNGAETFPVVVSPSAVLTALRMSGIESVFVRTAAEEDELRRSCGSPGASLAEEEHDPAAGHQGGGDPTNKRYGVRAHEDDVTIVTCAVQAQGYGTKTVAPLYVLSGMHSQLNKLDVEGTIATLTREGWAASVVRRIGGKFRTTWLVTADEPPPVWAFAVPNGVATFAADNKLRSLLGRKQDRRNPVGSSPRLLHSGHRLLSSSTTSWYCVSCRMWSVYGQLHRMRTSVSIAPLQSVQRPCGPPSSGRSRSSSLARRSSVRMPPVTTLCMTACRPPASH